MSELVMMQLLHTDALKSNVAHSVSQKVCETCFVYTSVGFLCHVFFAIGSVLLKHMIVLLTVLLPHASNDPFPDDVPTADSMNCLSTRQRALSSNPVLPERHHCRTSHGVMFRFTTTHSTRCLSATSLSHNIPPTALRSLSLICVPQGQSSLHLSRRRAPDVPREEFKLRVTCRRSNESFQSDAIRSRCRGVPCCPTAYCRSCRSIERNSKQPTCVQKYECPLSPAESRRRRLSHQ